MWNRLILIVAIVMLAALPAAAAQVQKEPPSAPYKKVSTLVKLPDFLPGIGTLMSTPTHWQQARSSLTITRVGSDSEAVRALTCAARAAQTSVER